MPSSSDPNPRNIPDMSLGDRTEKPPSHVPAPLPPRETEIQRGIDPPPKTSVSPIESAAEPEWEEGDRVLAPWEPIFLYPGTIRQIQVDENKGDQALIRYDDGGEGWVFLYSLCRFEFKSGQQVYVRRGGGAVYAPGEITDVDDHEVHVRYDDGSSEWTSIKTVRIPCVENGPGALGTQMAPWQTSDAGTQGGGIPSWVVTLGIIILIAFLRFGCRAMMQN